jgi:hypothetical protein
MHLLRKAAGSEQRKSERKILWAATSKPIGVGLPKPFEAQITPAQCAPDGGHGLTGFSVFPEGF